MTIANPVALLFRVIWWPFGFVLRAVFHQLGKSDRVWNFWVNQARAIGLPEELISEFTAKRAAALSGAHVVIPVAGAVEKSQSDQTSKPNEAKP